MFVVHLSLTFKHALVQKNLKTETQLFTIFMLSDVLAADSICEASSGSTVVTTINPIRLSVTLQIYTQTLELCSRKLLESQNQHLERQREERETSCRSSDL